MIEQELITGEVQNIDSIDGIIVTTRIPDGRVKLGAQVVQLLVEYGVAGEDKWENVILAGTKADRATAEEIALLKSTEVDENGDAMGIASAHVQGCARTFLAKRTVATLRRQALLFHHLNAACSHGRTELVKQLIEKRASMLTDGGAHELVVALKIMSKLHQLAIKLSNLSHSGIL